MAIHQEEFKYSCFPGKQLLKSYLACWWKKFWTCFGQMYQANLIPTNSFRLSNIQNTLHIKTLNAGEWRFHYTGPFHFTHVRRKVKVRIYTACSYLQPILTLGGRKTLIMGGGRDQSCLTITILVCPDDSTKKIESF